MGSRRQLFIDDRFTAVMNNLKLTQVLPDLQRENLLLPVRPWETARAGVWSFLLKDPEDGKFRLWYDAYEWDDGIDKFKQDSHSFCCAESEDGVHFEKSDLGLVDFGGSCRNNIILRGAGSGPIFLDPFADEEKRYRGVFWKHRGRGGPWGLLADADSSETWLCHSPDGLRWQRPKEPLVPFWLGATQSVIRDDRIGKWVFYLRAHKSDSGTGMSRRAFGRIEAEDLDRPLPIPSKHENPPETELRSLTDELPIVIDIDDRDPPGAQVYVSNVWKYPSAEDVYLAFVPVWCDPRGDADASDRVEVQLAFSRDGIDWQRPWRRPIISPGPMGATTAGQIFTVQDPVCVGDEIWLYYHRQPSEHINGVPERENVNLARAVWTVDRFAAVEAGSGPGELVTPAIIFSGERLSLNLDAGSSGHARVALEEPDGTSMPGRGLEESAPLFGNETAKTVRWNTGSSVKAYSGRPVKLRIELTNSRLYAFQFSGS